MASSMASTVSAPARAPAAAAVEYPSSDGKPMAESDAQLTPLTNAVVWLRNHFRRGPDVYVSGNLFIYYEEGNPKRRVAPDVFVVFARRAAEARAQEEAAGRRREAEGRQAAEARAHAAEARVAELEALLHRGPDREKN